MAPDTAPTLYVLPASPEQTFAVPDMIEGCAGTSVTVSNTPSLVKLPPQFVTITEYDPASVEDTAFIVNVLAVAFAIVFPFFFQTYVIGSVPVTPIANIALSPAHLDKETG